MTLSILVGGELQAVKRGRSFLFSTISLAAGAGLKFLFLGELGLRLLVPVGRACADSFCLSAEHSAAASFAICSSSFNPIC